MIFVDTGAFLARSIARDTYHRDAQSGWKKIAESGERCITSNFVLDETLTLLGRRAGNRFAAEEGQRLYASKRLEILRPDETDETAALRWFTRLADQNVSFTDCVSFALMKRGRIKRVFGFDRHFRAAGFEMWPGH